MRLSGVVLLVSIMFRVFSSFCKVMTRMCSCPFFVALACFPFFLGAFFCVGRKKVQSALMSQNSVTCLKNLTKKCHKKKSVVRLKLKCKKNAYFDKKYPPGACQFQKSPYLCTRFREATLLSPTQETRLRCWKIARRNRSLTDCEQYDKAVRLTSVSNTK